MSEAKKVFAMFPGQGSQSVGMGKAFLDESESAREIFARADEALGFSLSKICIEGPEEKLTETAITQPAILTVSTICYQEYQKSQGEQFQTCCAAGHSLGEYSALVAAEAMSFEDAVLLVHKRGSYMQDAVPKGEGKMLAVLGRELSEVEAAIEKVSGVAEIANFNSPGQIVVAGSAEGIDQLAEVFEGKKVKELPVSAPFHCSLMKPAADKLAVDLDALEIQEAKFPVYANVSAKGITSPDEIRQALKDQVCSQVKWVDCVSNALASGCDLAIEFGNGNVLTGLMKRIAKDVEKRNICEPANL